jgi:hypothetical protein
MIRLGEGKDGSVFQTDRLTAIKYLNFQEHYTRELRAYRILDELKVDAICDHAVPNLVSSDDAHRAIEMTIVRPPFLLDFVSAYTDEEMDRFAFDDDIWLEREATWAEHFGPRWAHVKDIRSQFHHLTGLTLLDLSLNNIRFE